MDRTTSAAVSKHDEQMFRESTPSELGMRTLHETILDSLTLRDLILSFLIDTLQLTLWMRLIAVSAILFF